ncbi:MAG: hypothetical protein ACM3NR_03740, partial [Methanosarcina sp.]
VVTTVSNKPEKNVSAKLAEARQKLTTALRDSEPINWPFFRCKALHDIDKENVIGLKAAQRIDTLFESANGNAEKISTELNKRISETKELINAGSGTLKYLNMLSAPVSKKSEDAILTLHFEGKTSMQTINDIERYTRIWNGILNDFALLTMGSECQAVIEMIDKNSIILNIPGGDKILNAISSGARTVIDTYSKILRIRKLQLEVQKLSLNNGIAKQLDNEISTTINEITETVVKGLMEMHHLKPDNEDAALFTRVKKSFKLILDFIEKGGKIECRLSQEAEDIKECNNMLLSAYKVVSEIEDTVKEIESLSSGQVEIQVTSQYQL